ncbi:TPA: uracil-DNA glycosylase [Staphylococcus aureus]|uniref:uracil-DNA glycosylase n=1 Tax=Staphylococcus aureus TaxID=1280 RepID=UPI002DBBAC62|nr:uracil-DNA glycosylase [Staphylococcus aureus]MEB8333067.1 uracil-DNA glycosylase [Staphylococcus aureus]HDH6084353.1 uracil-DNA glycosylase [Staphylococcus aureus]
MNLEKIAHDITNSLLPRALDRHKLYNEWSDLSGKKVKIDDEEIEFANNVEALNTTSIVMNYKTIYTQVLEALKDEFSQN